MLDKLFTSEIGSSEIRLLELDGSLAVFESDHAYEPGDRLRWSSGDGQEPVTLEIQGSRDQIFWAQVVEGRLNRPVGPADGRCRSRSRHPLRLRVRSREMPNFAAMTRDLSADGCCLETDAPVHPGAVLTLTLDNQDDEIESTGTVVWSTLTSPYHCGVRFAEGPWRSQIARLIQARNQELAQLETTRFADYEVLELARPGQLVASTEPDNSLKLCIRDGVAEYRYRFEKLEHFEQQLCPGDTVAYIYELPGTHQQVHFRFVAPDRRVLLEIKAASCQAQSTALGREEVA